MKRFLLCLGILALVIGVTTARTVAQEEEKADLEKKELATKKEYIDWGKDKEIEILDRNIRLEFKMVPLEAGDQGVFLITASSWYHTEVSFESAGTYIEFGVSGSVQVVEDEKLFVIYKAHLVYEGEEGEGEFNVKSSALVAPGKNMELARMGDKVLVVRASYED